MCVRSWFFCVSSSSFVSKFFSCLLCDMEIKQIIIKTIRICFYFGTSVTAFGGILRFLASTFLFCPVNFSKLVADNLFFSSCSKKFPNLLVLAICKHFHFLSLSQRQLLTTASHFKCPVFASRNHGGLCLYASYLCFIYITLFMFPCCFRCPGYFSICRLS